MRPGIRTQKILRSFNTLEMGDRLDRNIEKHREPPKIFRTIHDHRDELTIALPFAAFIVWLIFG